MVCSYSTNKLKPCSKRGVWPSGNTLAGTVEGTSGMVKRTLERSVSRLPEDAECTSIVTTTGNGDTHEVGMCEAAERTAAWINLSKWKTGKRRMFEERPNFTAIQPLDGSEDEDRARAAAITSSTPYPGQSSQHLNTKVVVSLPMARTYVGPCFCFPSSNTTNERSDESKRATV